MWLCLKITFSCVFSFPHICLSFFPANLQANVWKVKNATEGFLAQLHPSNLVNTLFCLVSLLCYSYIVQNSFLKNVIYHQIRIQTLQIWGRYVDLSRMQRVLSSISVSRYPPCCWASLLLQHWEIQNKEKTSLNGWISDWIHFVLEAVAFFCQHGIFCIIWSFVANADSRKNTKMLEEPVMVRVAT